MDTSKDNTSPTLKQWVIFAAVIVGAVYYILLLVTFGGTLSDKKLLQEYKSLAYSQEIQLLRRPLTQNRTLLESSYYFLSFRKFWDRNDLSVFLSKNRDELETAKIQDAFMISQLDGSDNDAVKEAIKSAKADGTISVADSKRVMSTWLKEYTENRLEVSDTNRTNATMLYSMINP